MATTDYRIESNHPLASRMFHVSGTRQYFVGDRALAVTMAAKSITSPSGEEIRVVHVPTGEIVFRKAARAREAWSDEV